MTTLHNHAQKLQYSAQSVPAPHTHGKIVVPRYPNVHNVKDNTGHSPYSVPRGKKL